MAAAETIERRPASAGRRLISTFIARREFGIFLVLIALILYFNARNGAFSGRSNWATLVEYGSPILIAAVGETMLLICGEIDLSVGHVYALAPLVLYKVAEHGWPLIAGLVVGLAVAAFVGLVNGLVTVYLRVPSLIVTLGHVQRPQRHLAPDLGRLSAVDADRAELRLDLRRGRLPHVLLGLRDHARDALRAHDDALGPAHDRRRRQPHRRQRERRQRELDPHRQLHHVQRRSAASGASSPRSTSARPTRCRAARA